MNTQQRTIAICFLIAGLLISGCGPGQLLGPTFTPMPTPTYTPTHTATPTNTPTRTFTPPPPTATPTPSAGRIQGKVYRSDSGELVNGVTMILFILETGRAVPVGETKTDVEGTYYFLDVKPGSYIIWLSLSKFPKYQDYPFCTDHQEEGWRAFLNLYTQEYPITLQAPDMEFTILAGDRLQKDIDLKGIDCK